MGFGEVLLGVAICITVYEIVDSIVNRPRPGK